MGTGAKVTLEETEGIISYSLLGKAGTTQGNPSPRACLGPDSLHRARAWKDSAGRRQRKTELYVSEGSLQSCLRAEPQVGESANEPC